MAPSTVSHSPMSEVRHDLARLASTQAQLALRPVASACWAFYIPITGIDMCSSFQNSGLPSCLARDTSACGQLSYSFLKEFPLPYQLARFRRRSPAAVVGRHVPGRNVSVATWLLPPAAGH